jgi:hypothetical protein
VTEAAVFAVDRGRLGEGQTRRRRMNSDPACGGWPFDRQAFRGAPETAKMPKVGLDGFDLEGHASQHSSTIRAEKEIEKIEPQTLSFRSKIGDTIPISENWVMSLDFQI